MPVQRLNSIAEITARDCYQTGGSKPIRVLCNDFNHYVCKYSAGPGPAYSLFNEFIAGYFLQIWQLPVPNFNLVQINLEHLQQIGIAYNHFERPCFGSQFNNRLIETDKFLVKFSFSKKDLDNILLSFLKISLFDIWLCNEDRNFQNMNLFYDSHEKKFVPIDHVMIFNGQNIDKEPYLISQEDSILTSPLSEHLFSRTLQQYLRELRLIIETEFEHDLAECHGNLEQILKDLPEKWRINHEFVRSRLALFFSQSWIDHCKSTFNTYLQISLRR
jgi:hypothetical protein